MYKTIEEIFLQERTCHSFDKDKLIDKSLLQEIYNITKMGPTSYNCSPLRMVFVESGEEKERLVSCVMDGNINNIRTSSITVIFAYDLKFYNKMDKLLPHNPDVKGFFSSNDSLALDTAKRNATLQAAYFIMVARSKGLAVCPMSGFFEDKINKAFLRDTDFRVDFICSLGYRLSDESYPRLPRFDFDEISKLV